MLLLGNQALEEVVTYPVNKASKPGLLGARLGKILTGR